MTQNQHGLVIETFSELVTARYAVSLSHGEEFPLVSDRHQPRMSLVELINTPDRDLQDLGYQWNVDEAAVILKAMEGLTQVEDSWYSDNAKLALGSLATRQLQAA